FLILYGFTLAALSAGYWIALILVIPIGGLVLRLFLIQHDCGHGSFFSVRAADDWLGRCLGVVTFTPYDCWRQSHAIHHASTGNLDARGFGDVDTLTVREYFARPRWKRALYRFYRHPLVLFGVAPTYLFLLRHRLPIGLMTAGRKYWVSALATNAAAALIALVLIRAFGLGPFLAVALPAILIAGSAGVWLFYVQHQFEQTSWDQGSDWSFHSSALHGSSHLALPPFLRWLTANIGVHHVHHLVSRIPFYRLPEVIKDMPELGEMNRITAGESWRTFALTLWDESTRQLVTFRAATRQSESMVGAAAVSR
ncbi:MAG: fatty acid desaturase, partial [Sphingomicrobium sp.]